jgi:hypothetical protein
MARNMQFSVMPAQAGISGVSSARLPHEIPASAGMTIWGDRHA